MSNAFTINTPPQDGEPAQVTTMKSTVEEIRRRFDADVEVAGAAAAAPAQHEAEPLLKRHLKEDPFDVYAIRMLAELASDADPEALRRFCLAEGALMIPHHVAYPEGRRGANWSVFREDCTPVVEIFSEHGNSEDDRGPYPFYTHSMGGRETANTARGTSLVRRSRVVKAGSRRTSAAVQAARVAAE